MSSFMLRPNESDIPYSQSALQLNNYMSEMSDEEIIKLIEIGKMYKNFHLKELMDINENNNI